MNLVQIQERLKDMPLQAVMMYANGMNPEVPPYLALGELNRRKKMEQSMQPAQMPQGTVKEKIEQEVGLAALQKQLVDQLRTQGLRQQQTMMNQGQQMARMPGPAPQGVPQPAVPEEVEMASGGVTTLMVPDNQFNFGSGGIIAFAKGSPGQRKELTEDDLKKIDEIREQVTQAKALEQAFLEPGIMGSKQLREFPERKEEYDKAISRRKALEQQLAQVELGTFQPIQHSPAQGMLVFNPAEEGGMPAPRTEQRPGPPAKEPQTSPVRAPSVQPAPVQAPVQAPQGIATIPYPSAGPAQKALASLATEPQLSYPDREAMRKAAEEKDQYLKIRPGEKLEQYLTSLERRDREDQARFEKMEEERARSAFAKALMAAGEASRGQRGIGALLGGFGRTAEAESEAARGREERQRDLMREREMNRVKMAQEIENARIAQSEGRFKDALEHQRKAAEYNQENKKINIQIATTQAGIEAQMQQEQFRQTSTDARTKFETEQRSRDAELNRLTQLQIASLPTGEERMAKAFIDSWMKQNPGKPYHEGFAAYAQSKSPTGAISGDRQQLAELRALQTSLKDQLNTVYDLKSREKIMSDLNKVNAEIARMAGLGTTGIPKDVQDLLDKYAPKR